MAIQANGAMGKGEYEVQVAEDGHLLTFVCAIRARLFDKKIPRKIMKEDYSKSSACIAARDGTALLRMMDEKVHPKNGLFWGASARACLPPSICTTIGRSTRQRISKVSGTCSVTALC